MGKKHRTPEDAVRDMERVAIADDIKKNVWLEYYRPDDDVVFIMEGKEVRFNLADKEVAIFVGEDGVVVITCTDERTVGKLELKGKRGDLEVVEKDDKVFARVPGGFAGVVHAFRAVLGENFDEEELISLLQDRNIIITNHSDSHPAGDEEERDGCGYLGLCKLFSKWAKELFGDSVEVPNITRVIEYFEGLGAGHVTLEGGHVGAGFIIQLAADTVLDPTKKAENSFFGLDLGLFANRLLSQENGSREETLDRLKNNEGNLRDVLVQLAFANMVAVYVLSNGAITKFKVAQSEDEDWNRELLSIADDAMKLFKEKSMSTAGMLQDRRDLQKKQQHKH